MEALLEYFVQISQYNFWVVGIELVLIGFVIYWAIDFLEGTRGEKLFRGVLFILISGVLLLKLLIERYPFDRLEYLYNGFLIAVLIIAVAAFQPEIRRALIRIGQPRFVRATGQQVSRTIEEIVSAVDWMSRSRTGAIIVIENRVALGEFIETGVRVNSEVSSDLLRTIFWPGTPMHDMAVVIRGDRVVAASVQLPLAEAGTVDGFELGSRHRAAIGISGESDASVIVVSEETGIVSMALEGKLRRNMSGEDLREHLTSSMPGMGVMESFRFFQGKKKEVSD